MKIKLDLHVHSVYSRDGVNTIDTIRHRIEEAGFHGYALADHDTMEGLPEALEKRGDLVVVPALEVTARGAHVIALEPQPICLRFLERWYGQNPLVTIVDAAVGATPGTLELQVSKATPTVTSLSNQWIDAVQQVDSFAGVKWDEAIPVTVTTLDRLIDQYGLPAFTKIDVEGYELEVLQGLSQPLPALSVRPVTDGPAPARGTQSSTPI